MKKNLMLRRALPRVRRPRRLGALLAVALTPCAVLLAATSFAAGPSATTNVDISKFMFGPHEITVAPGTTVRWVNHDEVPHTVASQDPTKTIASKAMDTDDKYELTFTKEGDFNYICTVHPFMTGVVHVHKP